LVHFFMKKQRVVSSKELGAMIKKRRKELGISQEKMAEELDVTYQQIQRYENGSNKLNVENLQVIAGILKMPVTAFFEGFKVPPEKPMPMDEQRLLSAYRGITKKADKNLVINITRLAAKD
jgi:transcriptional regulator with XRE-family HTH domain